MLSVSYWWLNVITDDAENEYDEDFIMRINIIKWKQIKSPQSTAVTAFAGFDIFWEKLKKNYCKIKSSCYNCNHDEGSACPTSELVNNIDEIRYQRASYFYSQNYERKTVRQMTVMMRHFDLSDKAYELYTLCSILSVLSDSDSDNRNYGSFIEHIGRLRCWSSDGCALAHQNNVKIVRKSPKDTGRFLL